jgi:hypothetical protein
MSDCSSRIIGNITKQLKEKINQSKKKKQKKKTQYKPNAPEIKKNLTISSDWIFQSS